MFILKWQHLSSDLPDWKPLPYGVSGSCSISCPSQMKVVLARMQGSHAMRTASRYRQGTWSLDPCQAETLVFQARGTMSPQAYTLWTAVGFLMSSTFLIEDLSVFCEEKMFLRYPTHQSCSLTLSTSSESSSLSGAFDLPPGSLLTSLNSLYL